MSHGKDLEKQALVGLALTSGTLATALVSGPIGWVGGPALLAAGEFYRRRQGLGLGEVSLGMLRFAWDNATAATKVVSGEAESVIPVYANVVQKAKTLVDHGVQRPEVDFAKWVSDTVNLRSTLIAGLPGEGKTHSAKALILAMLQAWPERYLKICTLDRGLSHDDDKPETWLGLGDEFFAETEGDIRAEIDAAEAEMQQRYQAGRKGEPVNKYPYIVFVDELLVTMSMLGKQERGDKLDKTIENLLVRGPKARVWLMGATQKLDVAGLGLSQATLKLFEFLLFPQLGSSPASWRNLPTVAEQSYLIEALQHAPQRAPKPVAVLRAGRGAVMTMPRLEVPDSLVVLSPGDEIEAWLESIAPAMAEAIAQGLSASKGWGTMELPQGVSKLKAKDNDWWQRYRLKYGAMQTGNSEGQPAPTVEDS